MNRRWAILGALTASCAALAVPACSSNDNNGGGSASDSGLDSTTGGDDAGDSSTPPETSTTPDTSTTHDAGPDASGEAAAACTVFDASGLDEAAVSAGFDQVWKVYKCWSCHQKSSQVVSEAGVGIVLSGNNDGLGDSGMIFPPNLTNDPTGLGCWTNAQVQEAMLFGNDPEGGTPARRCPSWAWP